MVTRNALLRLLALPACALVTAIIYLSAGAQPAGEPATGTDLSTAYLKTVRPLVQKYCLDCHSAKAQKGDLDLERFASLAEVRKDVKPWQHLIEQVEVGEMPPKNKPQPTAAERQALLTWTRAMLAAEARARTGDPGRVPLRRLSNTEYDCTIRDLTGVDLRPTLEFPADGAAGEGFTNAAEALSDITPALLTRYLNAAKEISEHVVLLPDGFRFSPSKTRRDWTDESTARLREFYKGYTSDGRLMFQPYLLATVRHRAALETGPAALAEVAAKEKLNPKYLGVLWQTLTDKSPSHPLDRIRAVWRTAAEKDVAALTATITGWQKTRWRFEPIGSYRYGAMTRQVANEPAPSPVQPIKLAVKPAPGEGDVVLYLATQELTPAGKDARVVWQRPRFEAAGKAPLLLKDYPLYGIGYEIEHAAIFADAGKYLTAVAALAHATKPSVEEAAKAHGLDVALLQRWQTVLGIEIAKKEAAPLKTIPAVKLELLEEKTPKNEQKPSINGWHRKGSDLPVLLSNSSNATLHIPGTIPAHKVAAHPTPTEFVAVAWTSPIAGKVQVTARIAHAHPTCGNGIAWWLEQRRGGQAIVLAEGVCGLGGDGTVPSKLLSVEPGEQFVLAVDANNGNHSCDLTEIALTITAAGAPQRVWDLSADVAATVQEGNPHADKHGNKQTWSFVRGPTRLVGGIKAVATLIPPGSLLGQWRTAAADPALQAEAAKLAEQVQKLLAGARPMSEKDPNRSLFDALVAVDGVLLKGLDLARFAKAQPNAGRYGLPKERFSADGSLIATADSVTEVRLPAALLRERELVVEAKIDGVPGDRVVVFDVNTEAPDRDIRSNGKSPVLAAAPGSAAYKKLQAEHDAFRRCFPWFLCFPNVVPTDEVVSLKMFHREDEPLEQLFLDDAQKKKLDHLWKEHLYISQQAIAENNYLPQFIGYVTQDQPKQLLDYFESQRPVFQKRADDFAREALAAEPRQRTALVAFAARAYRRPLQEKEQAALEDLYQKLRKKGVAHDEALRGVLTRVLVTPAFLFRIEQAPPGAKAAPIGDWELATRLSYFLWSSLPDDELRQLATTGKLREAAVLAEQTRRMLQDKRLRSLAIEFGTQWLHVRGFDNLKEKNEKLFPTFTPVLRQAIYEESILFFQDLFQSDRKVANLLDADYTFLNDALAKHYGIPGVAGPQWRRVEGVRKYGRGGILGLASVQAKQSGASRTSPVLRGNWVVETLLGEKLPRPPANVPILPDAEGGDKLTTRQMVEKHVSVASCAACHVRIDPYGFAFENFDAIGRWRVKESSGLPVDAKAKLRDGTEFEGIDGLRSHLLSKKQDVIVRLFCQRLLGYALGRATTLSDTTLIDEMVAELHKNEGRISAAVLTIVRSPQFRMIRGSEYTE